MERAGRGRRRARAAAASRAASPSSAAAATTAATAASARACCARRAARSRVVDGVGDLGEPDVIVDALLGIGLARRAARGRRAHDRADQRGGRARRRGRRAVGRRTPRPARSPGAAVRATATVTFGAAKVGLAIAPGRFHAGSVHVAPIGLRPREHEHALVPASALLEVPRKQRRVDEVHAPARCSSSAARAGSPARRCSRRSRRSAPTRATSRSPRRSRRCRCSRRRLLEVVKRPLPEDSAGPPAAALGRRDPRGRREGRRGRDRAGPRPQRRHGRARAASCSSGSTLPVVLDADALWELEPFARHAPTVLTPHARRARAPARRRRARDRRAPARRGAPRRVALRRASCC